jgi:predicted DNA-binding protein
MTKSQDYHLKMPKEAYDALQAIADKEGRLLADVIREALKEYTAKKGHDVSFTVDRGGNRRTPKEDQA